MVGLYWRGSGNEKNSRLGYLLFLEIYYSLLPSMFGGRERGRELAINTGDKQTICDFANKPGISKQQREFANKPGISKQQRESVSRGS